MNAPKPNLQAMKCLLYRHQWTDVSDWGLAFRALADLTDTQVEAIATPDSGDAGGENASGVDARR